MINKSFDGGIFPDSLKMAEVIPVYKKADNLKKIIYTLLVLTEKYKKAIREHHSAGAISMDLSKAFDCMPHKLLIAKFKAYGLKDLSIQLVTYYLEGRKQRVRVCDERSELDDIIKGVPQGSISGPLNL